jgi:phosphate transport system protein
MDTRSNFHNSLEELQKALQRMGDTAEEAIKGAIESLAHLDDQQAKIVIDRDDVVDETLLMIEELSMRLIALQQPMASDLRIIGTALKIATDLERIADHAVDIAKITLRLSGQSLVKPLVDIPRMAEIAIEMLRDSLNAYTQKDIHLASALAERDDEIDKIYSNIMQDAIGLMADDYARNRQLTHLILIAHHLERVGDHTTNIGENVIYMVTGKRKDLNI